LRARVHALHLLLALAGPARPASRVEAAIDALRHDSSLKVRTQAAIILGQRGAPEAVPSLRQAVAGDDSAAVRIAAVGALAKLRARVARPTLVAARESDPEAAVRSAASRALDALGPVTVFVEEPAGTPAARGAARTALASRLRELGFAVGDAGEIRLKPTVALDVASGGGRTVISVKTSLVVVDGDGHLEMMESAAQATVSGALPEARLAGTSAKVVDAAIRGVCQDLAMKLGRR
jgi:hypothetical protein